MVYGSIYTYDVPQIGIVIAVKALCSDIRVRCSVCMLVNSCASDVLCKRSKMGLYPLPCVLLGLLSCYPVITTICTVTAHEYTRVMFGVVSDCSRVMSLLLLWCGMWLKLCLLHSSTTC